VKDPAALDELILALRGLPGVGPRSARRLAFHLLQRDRDAARRLSEGLAHALERGGGLRHHGHSGRRLR